MTTWRWQVLRAGAFRLDGGAMFGVIPKALWAKMSPPDDANRIALQTNCLLLQNDDQKVLIETGYGNKFGDKDRRNFAMEDRWIVQALEEIDISPTDIDTVIVTHLHFDHAGGLTYLDKDDKAQPTFPNAQLFVQDQEWDDAHNNKSTMTKTYLSDHLGPVASQVYPVQGNAEILPGIHVFPVPGHTWGQQAVLFEDHKGKVCFPGDMLPTIHHVGSAFNMAYDMLPHQNMLTKQEVLARAEAESWRLVLDHEPGDPVVTVGRDKRGRFALHTL